MRNELNENSGLDSNAEIAKFIRSISLLSWSVSLFYGIVDFYNSSFWSSAILGIFSSVLFPIILYLNKNSRKNSARILLILGVNFFIFVAVITTPFDDGGRYFFVPSSLMTLLLYEQYERKSIVFGLLTPLLAYCVSLKVAYPGYEVSQSYGLDLEEAKLVNFFAMYAFSLSIVYVFIAHLQKLRIKAIEQSKFSALGIMSSGIAHEVNNPLAIIKGRTYTLRRHINERRFEDVERDIDIIIKTTDRINKIINGLRTFSRNGDADPFDSIDSSDLIQTALDLCSERFQKAGISVEIVERSHFIVEGREGELVQVLVNILNNGHDAVLELKERWIRIEVSDRVIKIIDSGKGIPKNIAEKLMQPFFTTKPVGKGIGLGLSISKGIIEKHGGEIFIDSHHSNTCFVIRFS